MKKNKKKISSIFNIITIAVFFIGLGISEIISNINGSNPWDWPFDIPVYRAWILSEQLLAIAILITTTIAIISFYKENREKKISYLGLIVLVDISYIFTTLIIPTFLDRYGDKEGFILTSIILFLILYAFYYAKQNSKK